MTNLPPPLTKTLFTLAVAVPVLLALEGVKEMKAADVYQWAGFICRSLGAGAATAVALLSFRPAIPSETPSPETVTKTESP